MQAPKNGFFYVLDRQTGEFISAENFVPVTWASGIDENGRPKINSEAKYWESGKAALVQPAWSGGHSWHPMSYSPQTGLVYIPAQEMSFPYLGEKSITVQKLGPNLGVSLSAGAFPDDPAVIAQIKASVRGHLAAWDPVTQQEKWRVQYPGPWNGGVLSTAGGLVFQGTAAGFLNAYNAQTGEKLWEFAAQSGIVAPPVSYEVDGEQYISVSVGWGGIFPLMTGPLTTNSSEAPINRSRLLTFKVDAEGKLPPVMEATRRMQDLSSLELDARKIQEGGRIYDAKCIACHGTGAVGGGVIPDLRYSALLNSDVWFDVVLDGLLEPAGMVGFGSELTQDQAEAVRQYVIDRNQFAHSIGDIQRLSR
tara:strand:- start:125 stop:1216 length:1092 start_codon:yes stop_codon:yes gene_type:complete